MSKRIVITGASSGIGKVTAELLASKGHQVLVSARRADALKDLEAAFPGKIISFPCDVTDVQQVRDMAAFAEKEMGGMDVLLNNAGLGIFDPLVEAKIEDWHTMYDVNVKGLLNCVHAFLPGLRKSKGQVINLGSVASHFVFPNSGIYCSTKHAVLAISESLRVELSNEISVTTISPGAVATPFIDQTKNEELLTNYKPNFASGLDPMTIAEQIAHAIELSDRSVVTEIIIRPRK